MSKLNLCEQEGLAVGATFELPDDASEYQWPQRRPLVGCNQLVCTQCGARVRSQPFLFLPFDAFPLAERPQRAQQLYDTPDLATFAGVEPSRRWRLYSCRCYYQAIADVTVANDPARFDMHDQHVRGLPWSCAGHPPAALPVRVGSLAVDEGTDLAGTLAQLVASDLEAAAALVYRLRGSALAARLEAAIASSLASGDAALRSGLLRLFTARPELAPVASLIDLAAQLPSLRAMQDPQPAQRRWPTLEAAWLGALAAAWQAHGDADGRIRDLLRAQALRGDGAGPVIATLGRLDGAWVIEHFDELLRANLDFAGGVLAAAADAATGRAVAERDQPRGLAARVAATAGVDRGRAIEDLIAVLGPSLFEVPDGWPAQMVAELKRA